MPRGARHDASHLTRFLGWLTLPRLFVLASAAGTLMPWCAGVWDTASSVSAEPAHKVHSGQPDRAVVQVIIDGAKEDLRACIRAHPPARGGMVQIRWQLEPEGNISNFQMEPPLEDAPLGRCLRDVLRELEWPTFFEIGRKAPMHLGTILDGDRR